MADSEADDHTAGGADDGHGDSTERVPVRRGFVELRTRDGEHVRHREGYVQYHPDAFVVSVDPGFAPESTRRFPKASVSWIVVRHPRS